MKTRSVLMTKYCFLIFKPNRFQILTGTTISNEKYKKKQFECLCEPILCVKCCECGRNFSKQSTSIMNTYHPQTFGP